jgi:alkylation response protein AidB-like acyl-CoA dehydrogenase
MRLPCQCVLRADACSSRHVHARTVQSHRPLRNFLKSQGTEEQKRKWLERAQNGEFIAAYCQTELGHGSNVRGLETTATFDVDTQEFEIHSPTLTSLKWWPTGAPCGWVVSARGSETKAMCLTGRRGGFSPNF